MSTYNDNEKKIFVPKFCESEGFYTTKEKSEMMGKIRSSNTRVEVQLRKALWKLGYRYRKNVKSLPGKPDIVFRKFKIVVFIDGDFWHGFEWETRKSKFKTNAKYWVPKIARNMQRDRETEKMLQERGFKILRFWEHEVRKNPDKCLDEIIKFLQ